MFGTQHVRTAVTDYEYSEPLEGDERTERLLNPEARNGFFETEDRPRRDSAWTALFLLSNALLVLGGIVSFFTRCRPRSTTKPPTPLTSVPAAFAPCSLDAAWILTMLLVSLRDKEFFKHVDDAYLAVGAHCSPGRDLLDEADIDTVSAGTVLGIVSVSLTGSVAMGSVYLLLLRRQAMVSVLVAVYSASALFFFNGITMFINSSAGQEDRLYAYVQLFFGIIFFVFPCLA